ncbi:hypothetical protein GCM10009790_07020 [Georgenia ruanii]|uniref:adenylyltransferase/cytidyltransferase family protein n=1 Tax=Georgenia ruanii TaxID=348442 RepID=UPI001263F16A
MGERHITGYVPGGFDMFHIGHLNILRAARERCDRLVVGVATDASLMAMKGRAPVIPLDERMEIVSSLRFVDEVVADVAQDKRVAWRAHPFDVLFKGTDWEGTAKGDQLEREMAEVGTTVLYLPYTPSTSSSMLRNFLAASVARGRTRGESVLCGRLEGDVAKFATRANPELAVQGREPKLHGADRDE